MLLYNFNSGFCSNQYPYYNYSNLKDMSGTNRTNGTISLSYMSGINSGSHYSGSSSGAFYVMIGAGDTAPTRDDFDMADTSIVASDKMVSLVQTATYTKAGGITATTQWKNNSSSPITIKELALTFKFNSAAYQKSANVIVARQVLDTPVTVQPGETYAFSYNIKV